MNQLDLEWTDERELEVILVVFVVPVVVAIVVISEATPVQTGSPEGALLKTIGA